MRPEEPSTRRLPGPPGVLATVVQLAVPIALVAIVTATTRARPLPHAMLVVAVTWFGVSLGGRLVRVFSPIPAASAFPADGAAASWEARLVEFSQVLRARGMDDAGLALVRLLVAYRTHAVPASADVDEVVALEGLAFDDISGHPPLSDLVALLVVLHDRGARGDVGDPAAGPGSADRAGAS